MLGAIREEILVYNYSGAVMKFHYKQKAQFCNKMEGNPP